MISYNEAWQSPHGKPWLHGSKSTEALQYSAKRGQQAIASALWSCKQNRADVTVWYSCWDTRATSGECAYSRLQQSFASWQTALDLGRRALPETPEAR